jgi:prepilin-type N-terminal cleavage/methylation domain-containing protein
MNQRRAFTLIELLTVIAIISLLAAIIFPVFGRVKLNAYKSSDISSMNSIRSAIQLYRDDQGGYPPSLLGYINPYQYSQGVTVVPANQFRGPIYPKKVDSLLTLKGSQNRANETLMVAATWPQADTRAIGAAPILDLNGDGLVAAADDTAVTRQAFSTDYASATLNYYFFNPTVSPNIGSTTDASNTAAGRFYAASGYDVAPVRKTTGQQYYEVRYSLFWTGLGITTGGAADDPRQLGYTDPPETTVITWNSFYRDYGTTNQLSNGGSKDIVLQLGGAARPVDSRLMSERAWRFTQ